MFSDNLRKFRKEKNMSQAILAEELGVTKAAISSWEVGRTEPNMGMVEKMAEILEVTKSDLIGEGMVKDSKVILSGSEKMFIDLTRQLSNEDKSKLFAYAYELLMKREE